MIIVPAKGTQEGSIFKKIEKIQEKTYLCKEEVIPLPPKNSSRLVLSLIEGIEEVYAMGEIEGEQDSTLLMALQSKTDSKLSSGGALLDPGG